MNIKFAELQASRHFIVIQEIHFYTKENWIMRFDRNAQLIDVSFKFSSCTFIESTARQFVPRFCEVLLFHWSWHGIMTWTQSAQLRAKNQVMKNLSRKKLNPCYKRVLFYIWPVMWSLQLDLLYSTSIIITSRKAVMQALRIIINCSAEPHLPILMKVKKRLAKNVQAKFAWKPMLMMSKLTWCMDVKR